MLDLDSEITRLEKLARACERSVLKAASAAHVTLVRTARESERMRSSLTEFISDVAPSQIDSSVSYDPELVSRLARDAGGGGGQSIIVGLSSKMKVCLTF